MNEKDLAQLIAEIKMSEVTQPGRPIRSVVNASRPAAPAPVRPPFPGPGGVRGAADPVTLEEAQADAGQQFPVNPGNWISNLADVIQKMVPQPGNTPEQNLYMMNALGAGQTTGAGAIGRAAPGVAGIFGTPERIFNRVEQEPPVFSEVPSIRTYGPARDILKRAEEWEKAGKSPQDIWKAYRVFRGKDGQWRAEMPGQAVDPALTDFWRKTANIAGEDTRRDLLRRNPAAALLVDRQDMEVPIQLGDVASPQLYRSYPDLMDRELNLTPQDKRYSGNAGYNFLEKSISASPGRIDTRLPWMLEHEIQHMIAHHHGWPRGAGTTEFEMFGPRNLPSLSRDELARLTKFMRREMAGTQGLRAEYLSDPVTMSYLTSAGEVEARNAARRMANPAMKRTLPTLTEDLPRDVQWAETTSEYLSRLRSGRNLEIYKSPLLEGNDFLRHEKNPSREDDTSLMRILMQFNPKLAEQIANTGKVGHEKEWVPSQKVSTETLGMTPENTHPGFLQAYIRALLETGK